MKSLPIIIAALLSAPTLAAAGEATETIIYAFTGGRDGANPQAALIAESGTFYGTTTYGGTGGGVVFSVTPSGTETPLHEFAGGQDGAAPTGALVSLNNVFYGTTGDGGGPDCGGAGCGTAFSLTPKGKEKTLYAFTSEDGANAPQAGLTVLGKRLYGTAPFGSAIFSLTTTGKEKQIYAFGNPPDGNDPHAGLINAGGTLYGTTIFGGRGSNCVNGSSGCGTVYSITGKGAEKVLYSFSGGADGSQPYAAPLSVRGVLYGTTSEGGATGNGVVFKLTQDGAETVLHSFASGVDGAYPLTGLIDVKGVLYGTTSAGGGTGCGGAGCGTVFAINAKGAEKIIYAFQGGADGSNPNGLLEVGGVLYGTTSAGGGTACNGIGCGTVFKIEP
jgi:uncharacterized repeat protein (TIGR03803 family)